MSESHFDQDNFNVEYLKDLTKVRKCVYLDLTYCIDLYVSFFIYYCTILKPNEELFLHVKENLVKYDHRRDFEHAKYFPNFNISDEQVIEYLNDPEHQSKILHVGINTLVGRMLPDIHKHLRKLNSGLGYYGPIEYWINTHPIQDLTNYSIELLKDRFLKIDPDNYITNITASKNFKEEDFSDLTAEERIALELDLSQIKNDPTLRIALTHKPCRQISIKDLKKVDIFFLNDLREFDDPLSSLYSPIVNNLVFQDALVCVPRRYTNPEIIEQLPNLSQQEKDQALAIAPLVASMYFEMIYFDPWILNKKG
jgi:hypothetical protein